MQSKNKIARNMPSKERLHKVRGENKYYVYNKDSSGTWNKEMVKPEQRVYARANSVSVYDKSRDKQITDSRHKKEGIKKHSKVAHKYDRQAFTGKMYKV